MRPARASSVRVVLAGAAIAIAGAAWLVDPLAEASFDAPKRTAVLGGAVIAALGLAWHGGVPRWRTGSREAQRIAACFALCIACWVIAAIASPYAEVAWPALRRSLLLLLLVPIGASRALDGRGGRALLGLFAIACASNALLSLAQLAGLHLPFEVAQAGGRLGSGALLGNEGYVAIACAMLGATGAAIALCTSGRGARVCGAAALLLAIATIAANRQATAAVALLVAIGVVAAVRCGARRIAGGALVLVAVLAASAVVPRLRAVTWQQAPLGIDAYQRLTTYRLGAWAAALDMAATRPWTGHGPGSFGAQQQRHRFQVEIAARTRLVHPLGATFTQAHGDYLQLAAEAGWPALLFALAGLAALLRGLLRLARGAADVERAVLLAVLCTGTVAALAWFPLQIPLTASVLLLAAGRAWRLLAGEAAA